MRAAQSENERIMAGMDQRDEMKDEAVKHLDIMQQRFQEELDERDLTEKHLRSVIVDKKQAVEDLGARVRELERQMSIVDTEWGFKERKIKEQYENQVDELRDQVALTKLQNEELRNTVKELRTAEIKSQNLNSKL